MTTRKRKLDIKTTDKDEPASKRARAHAHQSSNNYSCNLGDCNHRRKFESEPELDRHLFLVHPDDGAMCRHCHKLSTLGKTCEHCGESKWLLPGRKFAYDFQEAEKKIKALKTEIKDLEKTKEETDVEDGEDHEKDEDAYRIKKSCPKCNKELRTHNEWLWHMVMVHEEFRCLCCPTDDPHSFDTKEQLYAHLVKKHGFYYCHGPCAVDHEELSAVVKNPVQDCIACVGRKLTWHWTTCANCPEPALDVDGDGTAICAECERSGKVWVCPECNEIEEKEEDHTECERST